MPLCKKIFSEQFTLAVWRIEEELAFFADAVTASPLISNKNQQLQWYASRHLINTIKGNATEVVKDNSGKPFLQNEPYSISISHTSQFAAAMLSTQYTVGVDVEALHPKVERVAHKFLHPQEIAEISPAEKIEKLILYWSAKEALYKLYGKGGLEFKTQLVIDPFTLQAKGELSAAITGVPSPLQNLKINYEFFEQHVLTYVTGR